MLVGNLLVSSTDDSFILRSKGMEDLLAPRSDLAIIATVPIGEDLPRDDARICANRLALTWNNCYHVDEDALKRIDLQEVVSNLSNCVKACLKREDHLEPHARFLLNVVQERLIGLPGDNAPQFGKLVSVPEGETIALRSKSTDIQIPKRLSLVARIQTNEIFTRDELNRYAIRLTRSWNTCRQASDEACRKCGVDGWVDKFLELTEELTHNADRLDWEGKWRLGEAVQLMRIIHPNP